MEHVSTQHQSAHKEAEASEPFLEKLVETSVLLSGLLLPSAIIGERARLTNIQSHNMTAEHPTLHAKQKRVCLCVSLINM